jgi:hypothetical protein
MKRLMLGMLVLYRWLVSPVLHALMPGGCKYEPTCSRYAAEAIEMHGAWRGGRLAMGRLLRCHPFTRGGFDPVPLPVQQERGRDASTTAIRESFPALHDPLP